MIWMDELGTTISIRTMAVTTLGGATMARTPSTTRLERRGTMSSGRTAQTSAWASMRALGWLTCESWGATAAAHQAPVHAPAPRTTRVPI